MQKTPLYDRHLALGAKVIDFGGWAMPVHYTNIIDEHQTTRQKAGLFDICHMGEIEIGGPRAFDLLQWLMTRNLEGQEVGQIKLTVMTNEQGGIIDDLTIYRRDVDHYTVVTNAGTKDKDLAWIIKQRDAKNLSDVRVIDVSGKTGKLDIQGPCSQEILQPLVNEDLGHLKYYHAMDAAFQDIPVLVSRSGYTGEDGFEIYAGSGRIGEIWDILLGTGVGRGLKPVGLGARDTLRLEAGMMLYGSDMDETVTPLEVVYSWVTDLEKNFIGSDVLRKMKQEGVDRKLVGFVMESRGIARHGHQVIIDGREAGRVTSGTFTPTLQKAIGLAFVPTSHSKPGTEIEISIREHLATARVVTLPFYKRQK
jgi:aminomethyltransferase